MPIKITASMLYNLIQCPHRVTMDLFGDPGEKDSINPFIQLLWEQGNAFEQEVIESLRIPFTNLKRYSSYEKESLTMEAMVRGDNLIYGGRISTDDLLGEPDLLRKEEGGYVAGDIKSGAAEEGIAENEEGKPKKHYAAQLALYTDILERLGYAAGPQPFIWDIHGKEVIYKLDLPRGTRNPESLRDIYQSSLESVRKIITHNEKTLPAYSAQCKLCHWRSACIKYLEVLDDLTLIPELGRAKRDVMIDHIKNIKILAGLEVKRFSEGGKTIFPRIGLKKLAQFQDRAKLLTDRNALPYLRERLLLPEAERELFFDIETDPIRDICYLHGFVERRESNIQTERYVAFFADGPSPEEEERAFAEAWEYVSKSVPCIIYYYSHYERTIWKKLQMRYPHIASKTEIHDMFNSSTAVDLYTDIVRSKSEWPTRDHSIKTLAHYLGFTWRDKDPSGAASIEWYHRWVETRDASIRNRILVYNEDDCIAMRVLLDRIRDMNESTPLQE